MGQGGEVHWHQGRLTRWSRPPRSINPDMRIPIRSMTGRVWPLTARLSRCPLRSESDRVAACRKLTRCAITSCEQMQQIAPLFDDFVGSREQCSRHFEAERFGGLDVNHQLEFCRLLDRQICGLLTLENPAGIDADLAIAI